ncbi:hypothetical protein LX36DRAFT_655777 [Colletotrichum falcatum]|nr:hypothetical protein LX36DRAFT_655777 [Colletotrichum falcatum]
MAAQQRLSCLLHVGGVLVKQRASLTQPVVQKGASGSVQLWSDSAIGTPSYWWPRVCLTLSLFQGDVRLRYSNSMRQNLMFRNTYLGLEEHDTLGLAVTGRGGSSELTMLICALPARRHILSAS